MQTIYARQVKTNSIRETNTNLFPLF
jgi:hypothetical protein